MIETIKIAKIKNRVYRITYNKIDKEYTLYCREGKGFEHKLREAKRLSTIIQHIN